jgi:tocopherol O-methyltransferase
MAGAGAIRQHYDSFAPIYRAFWGDHIHHGLFARGTESPAEAQVALLEHCIRAINLKRGARVLDVGCGHGGTCIYLAKEYGCQASGITLSSRQAEIAREQASRNGVAGKVDFQVGDADHYDFPAATYDVVWTMESSEHFADKAGYFRRAAASLRADGKLLLAAWTGCREHSSVRQVSEKFLCSGLMTGSEYAKHIEDAGLRITSREELGAKVQRTWEICRQRARMATPMLRLLPDGVRDFVHGIDVILEAYTSGELSYTVIAAEKG